MEAERSPATRAKSLVTFLDEATGPAILRVALHFLDPGPSACGERQKGGPPETDEGHDTPSRCMGRSRGGLTTKIHALVDANGNAIALKLTEGQAHDGTSARDMLDIIGAGKILLADRAYDSDALRGL